MKVYEKLFSEAFWSRLGPHLKAELPDLWAALKLASAAKFVTYLPQGINTVVGDRGMRLSGGEQQRIAIARALLKNPEVLILDEATSFLDNKNEKNIQEAIKNLQGKLTLIVIAHRLSTIRNADKVYEIENGKMKLEQKPSRRTPIGYDSGSGEQERIFEK